MRTLLLIDANALIHRSFHALPPFTSPDGQPAGALYGLSNILIKIFKETPPDYAAAFFDRPETTFRKEIYEDYKAHRAKAADELVAQIISAHTLFENFGIKTYEAPGYEADDLLGTVSEKFKSVPDLKIIILTGDLDTLQLIKDDKVVVETLKKGVSETIIYNEDAVVARYGISPNQIPDYKGLVGDASDNIKGVKGVGPKTAQELISKFGSIENFFEEFSKKIDSGEALDKKEQSYKKIYDLKEDATLSKHLATIHLEVPVEISDLSELKYERFPLEQVVLYLKDLGFQSILRRLGETQTSAPKVKPKPVKGLPFADPNGGQLPISFEHQPTLSTKIVEEIEKPLEPILEEMRNWGIKADKEKLQEKNEELNNQIKELTKKIYEEAGQVFNINSPKQLLEIFKNKYRLKINSTNQAKIEVLRDKIPFVDLILKYRELFKLKSTYIEPLINLSAQSDPSLRQAQDKLGSGPRDGRIHPTFIQLKAATGRITCENPNLQNIPDSVREAFVAERGYKLAGLDYSQIELRIMASLTEDKKMVETFEKDLDIHAMTASNIFNVKQNEVTDQMRRVAKTLNFGIIYGMGSRAFALQSGLPLSDAKRFISEYFNDFPTIKKWQEKILKQAREKGYVENLNGRIRILDEIVSYNQRYQSEAERMAINFPVQSLGADIIKLSMIKTKEYLVKENLWDKEVKLLLTIHDELIFEIKDTPKLPQIVRELQKIMENVYELKVPIKVNSKIGKNWGEL